MKFPTAEIKDTEGNTWHQEEGRLRRLNQGVEGAHLCTPFQCELCWFRNLTGKDPTPGVHDMAIRCLRRCNLDNFAGRAPSTIRGHKLEIFTLLKNCESVGMPLPLQPLGPMPVGDAVGMGIALGMQLKSITAKGRIVDNVQFSTVRGVRGTATLNWQASVLGMGEASSFSRGKGRVRPTSCPTQSDWFYYFLLGMELRMGSQSQPDQAVRVGAIVHLLHLIKSDAWDMEENEFVSEANYLWKVGAYVCVLTAASLRGNEGFYVELAGLRQHLSQGRTGSVPVALEITKDTVLTEEVCVNLPHVTVALLGHFKGETQYDHHLIAIASETQSGLEPRWWIEKLVSVCASQGLLHGPAFVDEFGLLASSPDYNSTFQAYLHRVQLETTLVDKEVDVFKVYNTYRTLRKTATTRIERAGFGNEFVDRMNRWRGQEGAQGRMVRRKMNAHYADARLLMPTTWIGSYIL